MNIHELNEQRAAAAQRLDALGMANVPFGLEGRLKSDAQYRLAKDALARAESDYQKALDKLTTAELINLTK